MNPGLVVKLRPAGPWRIGPDSGARNRVDLIYHSDSLYSAVTSAMARLGLLESWLSATARAAAPEVCFSSCFPFLDEIGFVVPPRTIWPPVSPALMASRTRWKSARFVPLGIVQAILSGQRLKEQDWSVDGPSQCLVPAGRPGPFRIDTRWSAAVDRMTGASERHSTTCLEFRPGAGLWTVVSFRNDAARERWMGPVQAAFRWLADTGFGGERSRGWGRSETPEFIEGQLPDMILPPPAPVAEKAPVEAAPEPVAEPEPAEPVLEASVEARSEIVPLVVEPEPVTEPVVEGTPEEPAVEVPVVEPVVESAEEVVAPVEAIPEVATAAEPVEAQAPEAAVEPVVPEAAPAEETAVEPVVPEAAPAEEAAVEPVVPEAAPAEEAAVEPVVPEASPAEEAAVEPVVTEAAPAEEAAVKPVVTEGSPVGEAAAEPVVPGAAPAEEAAAEPVVPEAAPAEEAAAEPVVPGAAPAEEAAVEPVVPEAAPVEAAKPVEPDAAPAEAIAPGPETPPPPPPVAVEEPVSPPVAKVLLRQHWLLSLFSPAPEDGVDWTRGAYAVLTRGGRVESPAGSGELKKLVQMVAEGSVVCGADAPKGTAPDVAPDGFAHPVFRAGFALAIPLPEVRS